MNFKPVLWEDEVEALRLVRNSCREFMTRHTDEIDPEQQQSWWAQVDFVEYSIFLVYDQELKSDGPIGYGVIRYKDGGAWLTGGLIPEVRDKGLGFLLFRGLMDRSVQPCWLEVRIDNVRAHKLYLKLGFEEVSRTDKYITMRLP